MSPIVIRVENLSKLPRPTGYIGRARQRHDTLRDALVDLLPRTLRLRSGQASRINTKENKIRDNSWQKESDDTLWALKDVSFCEVRMKYRAIIKQSND